MANAPDVRPVVPPGSVVYAVGDMHGRADLLERLQRMILADAAGRRAARRVVVYLGDYVDRGPASAEIVGRLLDHPLPGFDSVHLLGNHEDFLLRFLDDAAAGPAWLLNGGLATLASYGVALPDGGAGRQDFAALQAAFRRRLPPRHRDFLRNLELCHSEGGYLFVHAGIRPGVPLDRQRRDDLLWIRDEFLSSTADHGRLVVHGHSIARRPETRANRIGIDTGAFASGRLTCLALEGNARNFLQT